MWLNCCVDPEFFHRRIRNMGGARNLKLKAMGEGTGQRGNKFFGLWAKCGPYSVVCMEKM